MTGENFSLCFSQDFWEEVRDDARIAVNLSRDSDNKNKVLKDMQRQLKNLTRDKGGRTETSDTTAKPQATGPGQRGPITLNESEITADMRDHC